MKTELIYGSTALKHWFPNFSREPSDLDIITYTNKENFNKGSYYSKHISPNTEVYYINAFEYVLKYNTNDRFVDPNFLYTIKVSHAEYNIRWDKTMHDIIFLKEHGCTLDIALYNLLVKEWSVIHRAKKVNLDKSVDEFFTKQVTRVYNHDKLHQHFAFYDKPLHESIRPDLSKAWCSEELFNNLCHEDKIRCCLEEIYVVATERFYLNGIPPRTAKLRSIKQLITTMTTGWFCLFMIENFKELLSYPEVHYRNKLMELVNV